MATAEFLLEESELALSFNYNNYLKLGGIINKAACLSALSRVDQKISAEHFVDQVERIASVVGINLDNFRGHLDKITLLYGVLRSDLEPGALYHHGQMSDERLFAEALRMLNRPILLKKLMMAYSKSNFL